MLMRARELHFSSPVPQSGHVCFQFVNSFCVVPNVLIHTSTNTINQPWDNNDLFDSGQTSQWFGFQMNHLYLSLCSV